MISLRRSLAVFVLSAVLAVAEAGCVGGSLPGASPGSPGAAKPELRRATARFSIAVPHKHHGRAHRSRYVSPSTESMSISIAPAGGGGAVVTKDVDLTPTSNGCAPGAQSTQCTFSIAIPAGSYLATIDTYDAVNEGGNLLSRGQQLPMSVEDGKPNNIALTLGGVPHSLTLSGDSAAITGTQAAGFSFSGAGPLIITALDADGNTIVGAGTPYSGSVVDGTGWSISAAPNSGTPNEIDVTPGKNGSTATLKVTVGYDAQTCALAGVVCSATFSVSSVSLQYLFVGDCEMGCTHSLSTLDALDIYQSPYTGAPVASITNGIDNPVSIVEDSSGRVYVANCGTCRSSGSDTVSVYVAPFSASSVPIATITNGISHPIALALNSNGDLFVWDCAQSCLRSGSDTITRYTGSPSDASSPATTIVSPFYTGHMAIDSSDNLMLLGCPQLGCYMEAQNPASLLAYAPPYTGTPATVTNGIPYPTALGVDKNGHTFVGGQLNCASSPCPYQVSAYSPPYSASSAPAATIANGVDAPYLIGTDATGNIFVASDIYAGVVEYPPSLSDASPITLFGSSGYGPTAMAIDGQGDIFLSDQATVQLGATPYSTLTPIASGLNIPGSIAVSP